MSKTPRSTGRNPFDGASRTPGSLGVNDAGSPDRPKWLTGDTPGPLGANDHAAAISNKPRHAASLPKANSVQWERLLDSLGDWNNVSGPPIAWNSEAHFEITSRAASDAGNDGFLRDAMPPRDVRRRILKVLSMLPDGVVDVDITFEQGSDSWLGHILISQDGQATHFMANKGQSQAGAYRAGVDKVFRLAEDATRLFRKTSDDASLRSRSGSWLGDAALALAESLHALQDSFSPAHVQRDEQGNIMRIFAWADQRGKDHDAGDRKWRDANGNLTKLGHLCAEATSTLLTYFILRVVNKDADAEQYRRLLLKVYLHVADASRSGWSP